MKRKRSDLFECLLPVDIGLKIVSSLEAVDVFSLASCSRFWREVCGYAHIWKPLCRDRWGSDSLDEEHSLLKAEYMKEVLIRCKIVNKRVCIRWSQAKSAGDSIILSLVLLEILYGDVMISNLLGLQTSDRHYKSRYLLLN